MAFENEKVCLIDDTTVTISLEAGARFACSKCGARAHDAVNVCAPIQLPEVGAIGGA
ncbi:MAG TPA: hypothetical protein VN642_16685 [Dongiaceae bacterium]|nr:hypothetical protein [Dongiaceae bacterium]